MRFNTSSVAVFSDQLCERLKGNLISKAINSNDRRSSNASMAFERSVPRLIQGLFMTNIHHDQSGSGDVLTPL